ISDARLKEAPVAVALHRYVEGIIAVNRKWPVDLTRMLTDDAARERRTASVREVDIFLQRAVDEGAIRAELPEGWASALLPQLTHLVVRQMPDLSDGQAADLVVDTLVKGLGPA
ncbi:TetR family transcriptional regulator, partial [Streptomyces sp. A475]|uniref:TetR family transcriptional regulator n=1 Tax=Streptomyces sp. A475 TaxID=3131976 RepID=UPI0030C92B17